MSTHTFPSPQTARTSNNFIPKIEFAHKKLASAKTANVYNTTNKIKGTSTTAAN